MVSVFAAYVSITNSFNLANHQRPRHLVTATCEQEVFNNLTYFVNPNYPDLTTGMSSCRVKVKKIDPEVVQIRFDFIHFNLVSCNIMWIPLCNINYIGTTQQDDWSLRRRQIYHKVHIRQGNHFVWYKQRTTL